MTVPISSYLQTEATSTLKPSKENETLEASLRESAFQALREVREQANPYGLDLRRQDWPKLRGFIKDQTKLEFFIDDVGLDLKARLKLELKINMDRALPGYVISEYVDVKRDIENCLMNISLVVLERSKFVTTKKEGAMTLEEASNLAMGKINEAEQIHILLEMRGKPDPGSAHQRKTLYDSVKEALREALDRCRLAHPYKVTPKE